MAVAVTRTISFSVSDDLRIRRFCNQKKVNRSWLVREALNYYLDRMSATNIERSRINDPGSVPRKKL